MGEQVHPFVARRPSKMIERKGEDLILDVECDDDYKTQRETRTEKIERKVRGSIFPRNI